jgi:succinate dehydrogenase / fumarate reductase cytochrome b subunit
MMISTGYQMHSRPKYLNLLQIQMPIPAIISIMHRVSGAVLFFALPLLLWVWQQSLVSFGAFGELRLFFANWLVKLIAIGLLWGFFHHLLCGLRFLALDLHIGGELEAARASSRAVFAGGILLAAVAGWLIW